MPKALPTLNFSNTLKTWIIVSIAIIISFYLNLLLLDYSIYVSINI